MFFKKKEEPKPIQMGIPTINRQNPVDDAIERGNIPEPPSPPQPRLEPVDTDGYIDTKGSNEPQFLDNIDEKPTEIPHSITISGSKEWVEAVISQLNR